MDVYEAGVIHVISDHSRKKAPDNDIDVYLQPLVQELAELWSEGMKTYELVVPYHH